MRKLLSFLALIALALFSACLFGPPKSYILELNLEQGSHYQVIGGAEQLFTTSFLDQEMTLSSSMKFFYTYDVRDIDSDGNFDILETLNRVIMTTSLGGNNFEYDTDDPPDNVDPSLKILNKMIGSSTEIKVSTGGRVISASGGDEMLGRLMEQFDNADSVLANPLFKEFETYFSEDGLAKAAEQTFSYLPGRPVRILDTWNSDYEVGAGIKIKMATDYTFKSIKDGIASIDLVSQIMADTLYFDTPGFAEGSSMIVSGDATGTYLVDQNNGLVNSGTIKMNLTGSMNLPSVSGQPPMSFPLKMVVNATMEINKIY